MPGHKKNLKQKLSDLTYSKPAMNKRFLELRKSFREVSDLLEDKKKK